MVENKKEQNVVGIIPARGGSKGIPKKNIFTLAGKPLLAYTIEAALNSKMLSRVLVTTDSEEIAAVALSFGVEVVHRPEELAGDDTLTLPVLKHALQQIEGSATPDKVVTLQPTSPLRQARHIDEAVNLLSPDWDAVISISDVEQTPYKMYQLDGEKLCPFVEGSLKEMPRQQLPKVYRDCGAVYVTWHDILIKKGSIWGENFRSYYIDPEYAIDIDNRIDLKFAEVLLKERIALD
jgi:CMP-N,N'-diacetyllegionaminic acid synthase